MARTTIAAGVSLALTLVVFLALTVMSQPVSLWLWLVWAALVAVVVVYTIKDVRNRV